MSSDNIPLSPLETAIQIKALEMCFQAIKPGGSIRCASKNQCEGLCYPEWMDDILLSKFNVENPLNLDFVLVEKNAASCTTIIIVVSSEYVVVYSKIYRNAV